MAKEVNDNFYGSFHVWKVLSKKIEVGSNQGGQTKSKQSTGWGS